MFKCERNKSVLEPLPSTIVGIQTEKYTEILNLKITMEETFQLNFRGKLIPRDFLTLTDIPWYSLSQCPRLLDHISHKNHSHFVP